MECVLVHALSGRDIISLLFRADMRGSRNSGDGLLQPVLQDQGRESVDQQESETEAASEGSETTLPPRLQSQVLCFSRQHHSDDNKVDILYSTYIICICSYNILEIVDM